MRHSLTHTQPPVQHEEVFALVVVNLHLVLGKHVGNRLQRDSPFIDVNQLVDEHDLTGREAVLKPDQDAEQAAPKILPVVHERDRPTLRRPTRRHPPPERKPTTPIGLETRPRRNTVQLGLWTV